MNGHTIYPGYYGKTHRQIYESALRSETFRSQYGTDLNLDTSGLDLKPGRLERLLDLLFGNDHRRMKREEKRYLAQLQIARNAGASDNPSASGHGSTEAGSGTINDCVDSESKGRNLYSKLIGLYSRIRDDYLRRH